MALPGIDGVQGRQVVYGLEEAREVVADVVVHAQACWRCRRCLLH